MLYKEGVILQRSSFNAFHARSGLLGRFSRRSGVPCSRLIYMYEDARFTCDSSDL